jgi:outer membrane protein OmpA-like peptidoglycan-associated protein
LQVFGLVVTAEPYFAVTQPSDLVVMENVIRADTKGKIEEIDAKYELLQRGQYQRLANPLALKPDKKLPLEVYEARNAISIARSVGADRFAAETFKKAEKSLAEAEAYQKRNAGRKPVTMTAREAVQTAEDSRAIAVKRQEENALAAERQQSVDREARSESARVAAQTETDRVSRDAEAARNQARADSERLTREKDAQAAAALVQAERVKAENDARLAANAIDADRLRAENDARATAAKNEADRLRAENDTRATAAKNEADRLKLEGDSRIAAAAAEAARLKRENDTQRAAAQAAIDSAASQKAQLEKEKVELRVLLLQQFNAVLQTRDTARGLIVNMSDVLFDTGKFTLRPLAREKLAKVAGIVAGHPGLRLAVEGHTDSVGGDSYNQTLSEQRGESVRGYLTHEGMPASSVTSKGFGKTQPVASNDTAKGRQENRRVEIVISGEVIGTEIGKIIAAQ